MPNKEDKVTNEVIVNGEVLLSTRKNTVTESTLAQNETAQDKTGHSIVGEMNGGANTDAYRPTDPLSSNITDDDFIPFYDVSEQKKHNVLFSRIIDRLKGYFLPKTNGGNTAINMGGDTLNLTVNDIDASKEDNNVTSIKYPSTANILDNAGRIMTRFESAVNPNGKIGAKIYVRNYNTEGEQVAQKGIQWHMDKSGNLTYQIDDYNAFRNAIKTVDQVGVTIPNKSNLDNYKTAGTYAVTSDASAQTMFNIPVQICGKLIVSNNGNGGYTQFYVQNHDAKVFIRAFWENAWSAWKEIANSSNAYMLQGGVVTGFISANDDLNNYTTAGTYDCRFASIASTLSNCPVTDAFKMMVDVEDNSKILTQTITIIHNLSSMPWRRTKNNSDTWSEWRQYSTGAHTYELGTAIPANSDFNDYTTAGVYRVNTYANAETMSNIPVVLSGKLIVGYITNENSSIPSWKAQFYIPNHQARMFERVANDNDGWLPWVEYSTGKHTYELGTDIPANSDLNTYTTEGVYRIAPDATAITVTNIPQGIAGKLIVVKGVASDANVDKYKEQFYLTYKGEIYKRYTTNSGSTWSYWYKMATTSDITPAQVGNGYAVATVSGSAITATIDGFQLRAGAIVSLLINSSNIPSNCTLNISGTGAKAIYVRNRAIQAFDFVGISPYDVVTFMYDGTYYRVLTHSSLPSVQEQGYVADTSGSTTLTWGAQVNAAQIKFDIAKQKLRWNCYKNSAWRGDVIIADYYDIVHQTLGTDIPDNADFNSYTTNGIYCVSSNARALTLSNRPCDRAGKLIVMRIAGNSYITQIYITVSNSLDNSDGIYKRVSENSGSSWLGWLSTVFTINNNGNKEIYLVNQTSTADDKYIGISARIKDTTTGKSYGRSILKAYQDHQADPYGLNLVMDSGGNTIIGGGESAQAMYGVMTATQKINEFLFLLADGNIYLEANANTIANRQGFVLTASGKLLPVKAEAVTNNFGDIGESSHKLANIWTYKINGQDVINSESIAPALAKVGKSILPSWSYTSNTYTSNGITYTFNPSTGEITANGTATNDSTCVLAGVNYSYYWLPKGSYTLSGCPSGGSSTKYYICLNLNGYNQNDYGDSVTFDLTTDHESINNEHFYIYVKSGQTVTNLVFKPMLRPSWTSDTYEPCEDIHKGNCYVGTCTTAADQQNKIAYVDGYFVLRKGVRVGIKYSNTNTYNATASSLVTLNVNSTGDKVIFHTGATAPTGTNTTANGRAGRYTYYIYDGTYWVFDGSDGDNNSTNYLRNDASSVLTAASPYIRLKASDVDITQANNGVTASKYPAIIISDKNTKDMSRLECVVEADGDVATYLQVRNYKSDGTNPNGGLWVRMNKSGVVWYGMTNPHNFNAALGCGFATCTTAEATTAKVATFTNYIIATNGYVSVKFTYAVPASATLNINSQGAKSIYYRGAAIKANVIKAGDLATFIYQDSKYHLLGIDRTTAYDDLITGTGTAAQDKGSGVSPRYFPAKWTFDTGRTATAGDIITIKIPVAGHDYGVFVSVDNGSNYIPVALNGTGRLTTHFPINQTLQLVYEPDTTVNSVYPVAGGDARVNITGVWRVLNYRDNDTVDPCYLGFGYATCATAAATAAKVATLSNYALRTGGYVSVKFTYDVPANATLNINSRGAKNIYYRGAAIAANIIRAGDIATFIYSGQYHLIGVDRTDNLSINYSYNNSAATPSYITYDDTNVSVTQLWYAVKGDMVQVSFNLKFLAAKNYTGNTKLFHGLASPQKAVFCESQNRCFYLDENGDFYTRTTNITAAMTLWGLGMFYIKK